MTSSNQSAQSIQSNEKTREQKLEEIVNRFNDTETLRRDLSADRRYSKGSKGISSKDTSSYNESSDEEEFVIEDSPDEEPVKMRGGNRINYGNRKSLVDQIKNKELEIIGRKSTEQDREVML